MCTFVRMRKNEWNDGKESNDEIISNGIYTQTAIKHALAARPASSHFTGHRIKRVRECPRQQINNINKWNNPQCRHTIMHTQTLHTFYVEAIELLAIIHYCRLNATIWTKWTWIIKIQHTLKLPSQSDVGFFLKMNMHMAHSARTVIVAVAMHLSALINVIHFSRVAGHYCFYD